MYSPKVNIWANFSQQQHPILIWAELPKKTFKNIWLNTMMSQMHNCNITWVLQVILIPSFVYNRLYVLSGPLLAATVSFY